ncbi:MAG TPA: VTT domain-containing protein [Acidimicrobiales bacterium]|nr:VTT domain-containing protein [Acidimicrobiales bacterium]
MVHTLGLLNPTGFVSSSGYVAIFILSVLQSCCVPTSSELTLGFGGVLASQGTLSLPGVILAGAVGELVGGYIAWAVGRAGGRPLVERYGRYVLLSPHDLDRAEDWYRRHQKWGVLGSRLLPVIRNFVAVPAGVAQVPAVRFGVLTAIGSLLWDAAMALIGYGIGGQWKTVMKGFSDAGYLLGALAVIAIAFVIWHRWRSFRAATGASPFSARPVDPAGPAGAGSARSRADRAARAAGMGRSGDAEPDYGASRTEPGYGAGRAEPGYGAGRIDPAYGSGAGYRSGRVNPTYGPGTDQRSAQAGPDTRTALRYRTGPGRSASAAAAPSAEHPSRTRRTRSEAPAPARRSRLRLLKVPVRITAAFWAVKLLSTAFGEALSDALVHGINQYLAVFIGFALFVGAMWLQFSARRYHPWTYWFAVAMVAVFGTMAADVLHIVFHVPYLASTVLYAIAVAVIFALWYRSEGTLSIHSIHTPRREVFYWLAVLATFALGTALGDLTAVTFNLGYLGSGVLFAVAFAVPGLAYASGRFDGVSTFWIAYILTRPLGASFADWLGFPRSVSGLGLGHPLATIIFGLPILALVAYISASRIDTADPVADRLSRLDPAVAD